jgi:hypothetical protein
MSKPKVYYAIPIRGAKGEDATMEDMAENCAKAKINIDALQVIIPEIDWISVAPYDRIVQYLLGHGYVTIDHVLEADFTLGDMSQGLFAHLWEPSGGAEAELERQLVNGKPCLRLTGCSHQIWKCDWAQIEDFRDRVIDFSTPKQIKYVS